MQKITQSTLFDANRPLRQCVKFPITDLFAELGRTMLRVVFAALIVFPVVTAAVAEIQAVESRVQRTQEPTLSDPAITVQGVVLSSAGTPISGATVVLRAKLGGTQYYFGVRHNRDILARTTTDERGKFAFESIGIPPRMADYIDSLRRGAGGAELVAWSNGTAFHWIELKDFKTDKPVTFNLSAEAPVAGEVHDEAGTSVERATFRLYGITSATAGIGGFFNDPGDLNLNLSEMNFSVQSDSKGQFVMHHLPLDYRVFVGCEAPNLAREVFIVETGDRHDVQQMKLVSGGRETVAVKWSPIELKMATAKDVLVKVIDHEGKPVTEGAVQAVSADRRFAGWESVDRDGVARIQVKDSGKYDFQYGGDPLQPRLGIGVTADIDLNAKSPSVEIRLPAARELGGKVLDSDSGAPVSGVYVLYYSGGDEKAPLRRASCLAVSGRDGKFRLPALVGPGALSFHSQVDGYFPPTYWNQVKPRDAKPFKHAVNVPASGNVEPVTLKIARGLEVRGVVHGPSGKPAVGVMVRAENFDGPYINKSTTTDPQGRFTLTGLSPHTKTIVTVAGEVGIAERTIEGSPEHPWDKTRVERVELNLSPGIRLTGRILKDGKPIAGIRMRLDKLVPVDRGARIQQLAEIETNANGEYSVAGLAPGDGYQFEVLTPDGIIAPDWHHQSPSAPKLPADARDEVHLPDATLITCGQSLRGIVVDPAGKPVPGITVSAKIANGDFLQRPRIGPQPWMETDEQGRFELSQLPDKPLELMAYKSNPKGGTIRYASRVQPPMNQHDIRILYDPALDKDAEDLH